MSSSYEGLDPQPVRGDTSTSTQVLAERRLAARTLLMHPILTTAQHSEDIALVRRHGPALKQMFATQLGYPLVVEAGFARLAKTPLTEDAPAREARRRRGGELTPRAYAYVALVCAGLLAPGVGEQTLMSTLVEQLRADAASASVTIDESLTDRRALVAAIELLVSWGVLAETDGTVAAWGERREEALLTVNTALLPHILARPLYLLEGPDDLWQHDVDLREQPRRSLRRRLVENPLTRREDLTDAEADVLSRERRELARMLDENFGLVLEARLEGVLAYDPDEELTDVTFPGEGAPRQAALLLIDALIDILRPAAGSAVAIDGRRVPGALATWAMVDENLSDLASRNQKVWGEGWTSDPTFLRDAAVSLLVSVSLARPHETGLILHPSCYRYRPEPFRSPARARLPERTGQHPVEQTSGLDIAMFDDPTALETEHEETDAP